MLDQVREDVDRRITPLVSSIADDLKLLFRQESALLRSEVRKQVQDATSAGLSFAVAATLGMTAANLVGVGIVFLLASLGPQLPLWAWFLITAGLLSFACFGLILRARTKLSAVSLVPEKTLKTLKENVNADR